MNIDEKLAELNKEKLGMELKAKEYQNEIAYTQQLMANLNVKYLKVLGKIDAYEEMKIENQELQE